MPFTQEMLDELGGMVHFCERPGEVEVHVESNAVRRYTEPKIAIDGQKYKVAGTLILKTGHELRANLSLNTAAILDEPELLKVLGATAEEAFPFTWIPDRPLACHEPPPYPHDWRGDDSPPLNQP